MPIYTEDVKLMASQRLTDNDDGGGRMTGIEIVDGNVNNLFPDNSRLDRVYGRVSLRKAFVSVQTADTDTYSGAHVIISLPAADPNVSVCMFNTGDPNDERTAARDRVESYMTVGPRFQGWLWGDQPAGSRSLLMFVIKGTPVPDIGGVLCLYKDKGLANEVQQFVRVTKVELTSSEFTSTTESSEYGSTAMSFQRDILRLEIGDPLRETFSGVEISKNDALATNIYTTIVSDSSKYYGVMLPTAAINTGDIAINVNTIFTHLVPSAQGESPMVDLSIGEAGPVVGSGAPYSVSKSLTVANNAQLNFGRGIKPGTLTITGGGHSYNDTGTGILYEGTAQRGTVDYSTGTVTFVDVTSYTTTMTATAVIGVTATRVSNTASINVALANQGYNYTALLEPQPSPGTVMVDYMSQGKWYRLRDNGAGTLVPDIDGTGTGTVNYVTGSIIVTCAALPDVGSSVMYIWGAPLEVEDISGDVTIDVAQVNHQILNAPVAPGSLVITWPSGAGTATATDNGAGVLTGDATGSINYSTGVILLKPTQLPASGDVYTIAYDKYPFITASVDGAVSVGVATFNLPSAPIIPGTLGISVSVSFSDGTTQIYELHDNGAGVVSAPGGGTSGAPADGSTTSFAYGALAGTVDYVTGVVQLNLADTSGTLKNYNYEVKKWTYSGSSADLQWVTILKNIDVIPLTGTGIDGKANCRYTLTTEASAAAEETTPALPFAIDLLPNVHGKTIVPGSVNFVWGGMRYIDRLGKLYRNPDMETGLGVEIGTIDYTTGLVTISTYDSAPNTLSLQSLATRFGRQFLSSCTFRTPGAPLRPGSIQIQGVAADGRAISGTGNFDGTVTGSLVRGAIDYDIGIVELAFGEMVADDGSYTSEPWYDQDDVIAGQIWKPVQVFADSLTYACVVYSYIPLDADLIGLDPVRLPSDGRVPIVRVGDVVVIHNTQTEQLANPLAAGQIITLNRENIVHVELYDSTEPIPLRVPTTLFAWNEDTQKLTMSDPLDLTGYTQPLIAMHRIEDMSLVSGVQINGQVIVGAGLTNDYPVEGTYVSSALLYGDMQARAYGMFDQQTWTSVWSNDLIGSACNASYNEVNYPITVTNAGGVNARWCMKFTDTTHFDIIEEKLGIIGDGYITQDCAPINPATNQPYFFVDYRGWGSGWAAGNVVRFNTDGPIGPLWIARTTLQGPVTEPNDQFTIQIRGNAE
jgi:hypothetical protein